MTKRQRKRMDEILIAQPSRSAQQIVELLKTTKTRHGKRTAFIKTIPTIAQVAGRMSYLRRTGKI